MGRWVGGLLDGEGDDDRLGHLGKPRALDIDRLDGRLGVVGGVTHRALALLVLVKGECGGNGR